LREEKGEVFETIAAAALNNDQNEDAQTVGSIGGTLVTEFPILEESPSP